MIDKINFHDLAPQKYWQPPASWTLEKKKETTYNRIMSEEWLGARKMDGAFYKFVKDEDGSMELLGRTKGVNGDYLNKIEWLPQLKDYFDSLPNGTCLLGEVYFPNNEGSKNTTTIMGCLVDKAIQRQEKGEKLHYYIFDILAYDGISLLKFTAKERFDKLLDLKNTYKNSCVEYATYLSDLELWNELQKILANDKEGIVMTRANSFYQPDKRPSKDCQKVKKELQQTIDCFVIGANPPTKEYSGKEIENWKFWIDATTDERLEIGNHYRESLDGKPYLPVTKNYYYKWAGSLRLGLFTPEGKVLYFGDLSGITDEVKENWKDYVGKVCEIGGMELFKDTQAVRHPKLICWRPDKTDKECLTEQLYEN